MVRMPHDRLMVAQQRRRIAEGREAEIFEYGEDTVLKLYWGEPDARRAELEAAAINTVRVAGGPAPEARGIVNENGRTGLIMERVDGPDMLTLLGKKPWFMFSAGRILGETHAALNEVAAPPELPLQKERFRRHIEAVAAHAPEHATLAEFVLRELDAAPQGDRICHGDYHPGNVLVTPRGPRVIDWPNATSGDPHADVARMLLVFDIASVPPGAPTIVRRMEKLARRYIRSQYIAAYRRKRPLDDAVLARWRVPVAGERLSDGIDDEREKLTAILYRAMHVAPNAT
jgi:aminoglycoside phosphotransferase (APT) family kinase protein